MYIKDRLINLYVCILDFILPKKPEVYEIEGMSVEKLFEKLEHSNDKISDFIYSVASYRGPYARKIVWEIKYNKNKKIASLASSIMADELIDILADLSQFENFNNPVFIPIPISKKRYSERGFNQSEFLASLIVPHIEGATLIHTVLMKTKETAPQSSLKRKERLTNLKGCFSVISEEKIKGRNIILIDDVTTTGTTLSETRKTLLNAGAKNVIAITFAH